MTAFWHYTLTSSTALYCVSGWGNILARGPFKKFFGQLRATLKESQDMKNYILRETPIN